MSVCSPEPAPRRASAPSFARPTRGARLLAAAACGARLLAAAARGAWLVAAVALAGCGSDDEGGADGPAAPYVRPVPVAGCEALSYAACDILDGACQAQWDTLVGCLRGVPPGAPVPVRVISETDFAAELRAGSTAPPPEATHSERALGFLELVLPGEFTGDGALDDYVSNVGAYYSSEDQSITVIDHGRPADGISANSILAHELVHAAQDRELGLKAYREAYAKSFDSALASDALVENEAELYQVLTLAALNGIDLGAVDLASVFSARSERSVAWALTQDSAYLAADSSFPYGPGGNYVYGAFAAGGPQGVRDLFVTPPGSTRQVLLGAPPGAEAPGVDFGAAPQVPGYELHFEDALGAFGVMLFVRHEPRSMVMSMVEPFRNDRLYIYGSASGTALAWRLAFSTPQSGDTFMAIAQSIVRSQARVTRDAQGNVLVLKASDDAGLGALVGAFPSAP